jgi:hypothetical protein
VKAHAGPTNQRRLCRRAKTSRSGRPARSERARPSRIERHLSNRPRRTSRPPRVPGACPSSGYSIPGVRLSSAWRRLGGHPGGCLDLPGAPHPDRVYCYADRPWRLVNQGEGFVSGGARDRSTLACIRSLQDVGILTSSHHGFPPGRLQPSFCSGMQWMRGVSTSDVRNTLMGFRRSGLYLVRVRRARPCVRYARFLLPDHLHDFCVSPARSLSIARHRRPRLNRPAATHTSFHYRKIAK